MTKYTEETKPGMADPYWYEWSVGQRYLVDMLNPDSHIHDVELQANVQLGLSHISGELMRYVISEDCLDWNRWDGNYTMMKIGH